jgi:hypothetical protein
MIMTMGKEIFGAQVRIAKGNGDSPGTRQSSNGSFSISILQMTKTKIAGQDLKRHHV